MPNIRMNVVPGKLVGFQILHGPLTSSFRLRNKENAMDILINNQFLTIPKGIVVFTKAFYFQKNVWKLDRSRNFEMLNPHNTFLVLLELPK